MEPSVSTSCEVPTVIRFLFLPIIHEQVFLERLRQRGWILRAKFDQNRVNFEEIKILRSFPYKSYPLN